jgi:hypothetical protein
MLPNHNKKQQQTQNQHTQQQMQQQQQRLQLLRAQYRQQGPLPLLSLAPGLLPQSLPPRLSS